MNAVQVEINGVEYTIGYDGALTLRDSYGEHVELAPGVLFGLSVFLRWPGVRPLLNVAEQDRQRQGEGSNNGQ